MKGAKPNKEGVGGILPSDRRGLLSRVGAGMALALGGALGKVMSATPAQAQTYTGITDNDSGAAQDSPGYWLRRRQERWLHRPV